MQKLISANLKHLKKINPCFQIQYAVSVSTLQNTRREIYHNANQEPKPSSQIPKVPSYPVLKSLPTILSIKDFDTKRAHHFWYSLVETYGPLFKMEMPFTNVLVAANPENLETAFRVTAANPIRVGLRSIKKIRRDFHNGYFGKRGGLFVENNETWWDVRTKVQPPMMKPKMVETYLQQMEEVVNDFIKKIEMFQEDLGEMPDTFLNELNKWTFESLGVVALNKRLGCLQPNLQPGDEPFKMVQCVNDLFEAMNETESVIKIWRIFPALSPSYNKLSRTHDQFFEIVNAAVEETEANLNEKMDKSNLNILETFLTTPGLSRRDVIAVLLDIFSAGVDTSANTTAFTLYVLARHPEVQKRLQCEVDELTQQFGEGVTVRHLKRANYLKCCVKETFRMFPIVNAIARRLEKDEVFQGYHVPKEWIILLLFSHASLDEKVFPKAKEYIPERWDRSTPLGHIHPYASLPFGHGPRMCVGRRLAEQEIYTLLFKLMQKFTIHYDYEDIGMMTKLVNVPDRPLKFRFVKRI